MASKLLLFRLEIKSRVAETHWLLAQGGNPVHTNVCTKDLSYLHFTLPHLLVTFCRCLGPRRKKDSIRTRETVNFLTINMTVILIGFSLEICWNYFVPHTPPRMPCSRNKEIGGVKNMVSLTTYYQLLTVTS